LQPDLFEIERDGAGTLGYVDDVFAFRIGRVRRIAFRISAQAEDIEVRRRIENDLELFGQLGTSSRPVGRGKAPQIEVLDGLHIVLIVRRLKETGNRRSRIIPSQRIHRWCSRGLGTNRTRSRHRIEE
jgi:hypothetical protein